MSFSPQLDGSLINCPNCHKTMCDGALLEEERFDHKGDPYKLYFCPYCKETFNDYEWSLESLGN